MKKISKCPDCECNILEHRETLSGTGSRFYNIEDGSLYDASGIYDYVNSKPHKRVYCMECGLCLGKAEDYNLHE